MATYVLIHGSWHGGWCWEKLISLLKAKDHQVYAPDLPGHGKDKTPIQEITFKHYVDALCNLLDTIEEPVILVGHSMGGIVISQAAEYRPQKIAKLIYLAAFLPKNGESMMTVAHQQAPTRFVKMMKVVPEENAFYFPKEAMQAFSYHLAPADVIDAIQDRICVEPLQPLQTPVMLSEARFGQIPKMYIECLEDRAILLETQRKMTRETNCEIVSLPCDHGPFYSDPKSLCDLLERGAKH